MPRAYISLGSNLGNRLESLGVAVRMLGEHPMIRIVKMSPVYETQPVGGPAQPNYLNAVVEMDADLQSPSNLLEFCLHIEREMGRVRSERWGPRVIDIDVLHVLGVDACMDGIDLPHPRMLERRFVLQPLCDIAPDLLLGGKTIREHLQSLRDPCSTVPLKEAINIAGL
ncbi:MAG: 2-amino-4-hydroxy-6-hydroxymethyldihydropteridine diphosphokinase [Armatimonadetes bacterium]|nr:2-amino-4-hydroxy-6-hydroxymethyldihydropteridine diphosphokinase [Armatimonadota bacterium]PIX38583.1 MAG: 2-amino-4-hydroxy-6-hydroxymethyldihydropteridine diphosphokinase [Armatimonadetes bacterium CG_4_8_14_3_um_filter_58_9]PJB74268.1 MAG: 2-amino-4-hydroxy-6-hydroxymethyldihydropteridine diphosphokinase [Armatimonadetes bacterium CG_4_9_14_3_um_filter_58_7]